MASLSARGQAYRNNHRVEQKELLFVSDCGCCVRLWLAPGPAATAGFRPPGRQHWKMLVMAPGVVDVLAAALYLFLAEWDLVVPWPLGMHTLPLCRIRCVNAYSVDARVSLSE